MSVAIKKQVLIIKAEGDAHTCADIARDALKKLVSSKSRTVVRAKLLPVFASVYAVSMNDGEGKAKGTKVLDSDASAYEACRKALGRTIVHICGAVSSSGKVEAPAKLTKSITKMIIDSGIDSAQFNALLAAVRSGVEFK